jgi:hypothetical protein
MTVTTVRLADSLQTLVDARLDTIDRMLVGRVPRADRLAIVGEVEAQIVDMLQRHDPGEPTREDVLAILGRLIPPEAFLPEHGAGEAGSGERRATGRPGQSRTAPDPARVARTSGLLGISSLALFALVPLPYFAAAMLGSEVALLFGILGLVGLMLVCGILATALGISFHRAGPWALVGVVTGSFSILLSLINAAFWVHELL